MEIVAIVGVGLIGASFGLALRRAGFTGRIIGVSSRNAIEAGLANGAISEEMSLGAAAEVADLIYLAQPVERILQTLEILGSRIRPECLVTDAGSTKSLIVSRASNCMPPSSFLGGHPMAGKEQRGAEAAEALLFRNRPYILTPSTSFTPRMENLRAWLEKIDARVILMSAAEHDKIVALTSHLPQLISTAISITLAKHDNPRLKEVFGPGLLDMTRLAMSSPDLWQSILDTNREPILDAIENLTKSVDVLAGYIKTGSRIDELFEMGSAFATGLRKTTN